MRKFQNIHGKWNLDDQFILAQIFLRVNCKMFRNTEEEVE